MSTQDNRPVMMYVHGFLSGANGTKQKQLQKKFEHFRVIAPELDADPDKSLAILNKIIKEEKPKIIIGTSLGGFMTIMCDSPEDTQLIVVNPSTTPFKTLGRWLNQEMQYFCKRLDGVQTYVMKQEVLDKYKKYDIVEEVKKKVNRLKALCSTNDELIGTEHIEKLKPIMPEENLWITDKFGHQCRDAGMDYLNSLIEIAIQEI